MPIEILYQNPQCEWIDVEAPTAKDLAYIHEKYHINTLLLEDTTDPNHLPKFEQDGNLKFFLMRENTELERRNLNNLSDVSTKLGVFLFKNKLITIHRMKNRSIRELKEEIVLPRNENISPDKIALILALKVMKSFDEESTHLLEKMDLIENEIFLKRNSNANQIRRLYQLKRKAGLNARILSASSDWIKNFQSLNIHDAEMKDLQDKHDDVITDFEHLTAQATNLISMFLAMSDQRANQVMKVLAIYSMYFFPLTFIAGIYGMNFDNMPELHQPFGYFITLGVMAFIALLTFLYVRRKKW